MYVLYSVLGTYMKTNKHKIKTTIILLIASLIVLSVVFMQLMLNTTSSQYQVALSSPSDAKIMLKVVCNEHTGYCELVKSLPDEQLDESRMVSSATPINESFDYKTFVKKSFISFSKDKPIRSYIKIADNPPPIFSL